MTRASRLIVLMPCLFAFACTAHFAQSPEEWVHYHKQGTILRGSKVAEIKRPRKAVETDLAEYASKCLDGMLIVTRLQQGMQLQVGKTQYTARLKASDNGKTMLSIQTKDPRGPGLVKGAHPDGDFFFVSEIQSVGPGTTKITSYYVTTSAVFADEVAEWANGVKSKCPKARMK